MPRNAYHLYDVAEHWRSTSYETSPLSSAAFWRIGLGEPSCFRCGWLPPVASASDLLYDTPDAPMARRLRKVWGYGHAARFLDLAHLEDYCYRQNDAIGNVLPLCHYPCHVDMPSFRSCDDALRWINEGSPCPAWWQYVTDATQERFTERGKQFDRRHLKRLYIDSLKAVAGVAA